MISYSRYSRALYSAFNHPLRRVVPILFFAFFRVFHGSLLPALRRNPPAHAGGSDAASGKLDKDITKSRTSSLIVSENRGPIVMKFGGTSVGDVAAFERVFHIVSTQIERRPVVVVSAMTKVTDALLNAFDIAKKGDAAEACGARGHQF